MPKIKYPTEEMVFGLDGLSAVMLVRMMNCTFCDNKNGRSMWIEEMEKRVCLYCEDCKKTEYIHMKD